MTGTTAAVDRGVPELRVLFGTERFSSQHSWSELTALMPGALGATVDVQWCPPGAFAERARSELFDVVVPLWAELDAETIQAGRFGLIQQFGAGVENIAIAAATSAGVWVANMPGLNAVDVAEHAVLLLLALLRRLPDSTSGLIPGTGETRPLRHSPEAPSASSGSEQSGHSWPDGSTRSKFGYSACGETFAAAPLRQRLISRSWAPTGCTKRLWRLTL